jgi:hypothetical protein
MIDSTGTVLMLFAEAAAEAQRSMQPIGKRQTGSSPRALRNNV